MKNTLIIALLCSASSIFGQITAPNVDPTALVEAEPSSTLEGLMEALVAYQTNLALVEAQEKAGSLHAEAAQQVKAFLQASFEEEVASFAQEAALWLAQKRQGLDAMKEPQEEVIEEAYEEEMLAEEAWPAYPEAYLEKHQKSLRQTRKKKSFSGSSLSFGLAPGLANSLQQGQRPSLSSWLPQEGSVYAQSWELFFHQKRLGGSPFWLRYGLAWDYQSIDFGKHALIQVLPSPGWMSGVFVAESPYGILRQSSLSTNYISVPLWLYINGSAKGNRGLSIALGTYGGVRVGKSMRVVQYFKEDYGRVTERIAGRFYTNPVQYGIQARLGYKRFHVTMRHALSPVFTPYADIIRPEAQVATLAFGWDFH
jgi:hypothetical protein